MNHSFFRETDSKRRGKPSVIVTVNQMWDAIPLYPFGFRHKATLVWHLLCSLMGRMLGLV